MKIVAFISLFFLILTVKSISEITYLEILKDPTDLRLNLQYAKEQEAKGEFKSVIATLERLNALYPNNIDLKLYLLSILKKYIQDGNKKSLEQFDYHYSCDLKMFYLLNSYIQEQTDNFLSLLRNKNIQECTELYQSIKENYKNRMIIFEKDCNKNYKYIYEKL